MQMKKVVYQLIQQHLIRFQKSEPMRIAKKTPNMLEDVVDKALIRFFQTSTRQETPVWIHEDYPTAITAKK